MSKPAIIGLIGTFSLLAGCAGPEISVNESGSKVDGAASTVTSILNAGVQAQMRRANGTAKFLFDPLYDNHFGSLAEMDAALIDAIISGQSPYDGVDAVFVSHAHGDHFSAEYLTRMMAAQSDVLVIAPEPAVEAMQGHELWQASFAERITPVALKNGDAPLAFEIAGANVEALRTPHAGWPDRHAAVHNITYRVTGSDGARIMHLGDADPAEEHFAPHSEFFQAKRTGLAMVPFWFLNANVPASRIDETLNTQSAVGIHVPVKTPQWLIDSGKTHFSEPGKMLEIPVISNE